ncbi:MAG: cadherin-like beta sandwich domain-containing protein, partial [Gammaproteobacteria bacterium]|nr:cadherin-like beta sandwich domain-containing protein [Gammaproteobacteria bacterium]
MEISGVGFRTLFRRSEPTSRRRSLPLSALLLTGLLLPLAALFAGTAAAQDAYVSNTEQAGTSGNQLSSTAHQAQKFTTGSQSGGYALGSVGLTFNQGESSTGNLTVTINSEDSDGNPGTVVYTLTKPSSLTSGVEELFFAPSNASLSADTSYFVTVEASGSFSSTLRITTNNAEDSGGSTGWSINDKRHFRSGSTDDWGESANANKLKISVYPPLTLPWDTTMTVGASSGRLGYDGFSDFYGSLEDNTLVHDATEYEVRILDVNASEVRLRLGPNPGTSSGWVLEWGGEELPLNSATSTSTFGSNLLYRWDATWLTNNASSLDSSSYQTTVTSGSELTVCIRLSTQTCSGDSDASADATLSDLELQDTSDDSTITLTPTFASDVTSYTASVANDVDEILVDPTTNDDGATVEFLDADDMAITDAHADAGHPVAPAGGADTI